MTKPRNEADEAKIHAMRSRFARLCVTTLRETRHPRAEEYIQEAEHQDGVEFWEQFHEDLREMWDDFRLYVEHS